MERVAGENMLAENVARSVINNNNTVRQRAAVRKAERDYRQEQFVRAAYNQLEAEQAWMPRTNNALQAEIMANIERNEGVQRREQEVRARDLAAREERRRVQQEREAAAAARREERARAEAAERNAAAQREAAARTEKAAKKTAKKAAKAAAAAAPVANENEAVLSQAIAQAAAEESHIQVAERATLLRLVVERFLALRSTFNALGKINFVLVPDERLEGGAAAAAGGSLGGLLGRVAVMGLNSASSQREFIAYYTGANKQSIDNATFQRLAFYKRFLEIAEARGAPFERVQRAIKRYLTAMRVFFTYFDTTTKNAMEAVIGEIAKTKQTRGAASVKESGTLNKVLNSVYNTEVDIMNIIREPEFGELLQSLTNQELISLLEVSATMLEDYYPLLLFASDATGIGKNAPNAAGGGGGAAGGGGGGAKGGRRTRRGKKRGTRKQKK
jgi:hypothetical protein